MKENVQNIHRKRAKEYRQKVDKIESSEDSEESNGPTSEEDLDLEKAMEEDEDDETTTPTPSSDTPTRLDMRIANKQNVKENNMQKESSNQGVANSENGNMQNIPTPPSSSKENKAIPSSSRQNERETEDNSAQRKTEDNCEDSSSPEDSDAGSNEESDEHNNVQKKPKLRGAKPKAVRVLFKQYHCLSQGCTVTKQMKTAVLKHIKDAHKDYHFKCSKCPQTFASWIGHYKHKKRHVRKAYICEECGHSFQFPGELYEHERLHTGEDLIQCSYCDSSYPSKRAQNFHEKSHTDAREYHCDFQEKDGTVCGQVCISPTHLKQHQRGMHGEGWLCPLCHVRFWWSGTMYSHKKECTGKHAKCST